MNYYTLQPPSLQQIAEMTIVSQLWKVEDIKIEFEKYIANNLSIKHEVLKKVSSLLLPKILQEKFVSWADSLDLEIWNWWRYHRRISGDIVRIISANNICWTPRGTVDNKKTAELMVKDENVDIETRYTMACVYCFVTEIPMLWKRIPRGRQKRFYYFKDFDVFWCTYPRVCDLRNLIMFWTYSINGKIAELNERIRYRYHQYTDQFSFHCAVAGGNTTASRFFFEKLSCEGHMLDIPHYVRELLLRTCPLTSFHTEVILFMMKQMNEEQQEKVFKDYAYNVLARVLRWPYQSLFMEMAKKWIGFLSRKGYQKLLQLMCKKIICHEADYYSIREMFQEFWQLGSVNYDDFFKNFFVLSTIMDLFEVREKKLVKYVLDQTTDFQINQLINAKDEDAADGLILLIDKEKWKFLKFLLGNTSKETIITLKRNVASQLSSEEDLESKVKLTKAFHLVNEFIQ